MPAAAVMACGGNGEAEQDRDNAVAVNSSVVEVDTLPADESSATPTDDLVNGATEPTAEENGY